MRLDRSAALLVLPVLLSSASPQQKPVVQFRSNCPKGNASTPRLPSDISTLEVVLRRTACFGSCPVYQVKIKGSGLVTYEGMGWVKETGLHTTRIPIPEVRRLAERFVSEGYFKLCGTYGAPSELPGATIALKWTGVKKTVINHGGFVGAIPKELFELAVAIDEATNSLQWVGYTEIRRIKEEEIPPPDLKMPPQPLPSVLANQPNTHAVPH
jgi:hypothetical protein